MLPGTLMRNDHLKFNCQETTLRVEATDSPFTSGYKKGQLINLPVAHAEGNYFADAATLKALNDNGQIVLRYTDAVNGAQENIAGITNRQKNVLGLMPHPERHAESALGGSDGAILFQSLLKKLAS
jgi:phosphoribosylformylglycinamidine synthase